MAKNTKMTTCKNCNTAIGANVRRCPACGAKNKPPFYKRGWFLVLLVLVILGAVGSVSNKIKDREEKKTEYTWPDSTLAGMLPQPDSKYGRISRESEDSLQIDIYKVSPKQFEEYIEKCKENGFTIDYSRTDSTYMADNATGHSLRLYYDDGEKDLSISLDAPMDISKDIGEVDAKTDGEESSSSGEEVREGSQQDAEPGDGNDQKGEDGETTGSEEGAEETTETESAGGNSDSGLVDGMRPEFKEAMDSYEAFYEEYFEFMETYKENPSDLKLLAKYTDFMTKLVEMDEKFAAWDQGAMNEKELKYYLEVSGRIAQKLLEMSEGLLE